MPLHSRLPIKPVVVTVGGFVVLEQAIANLASLHSAIAPTAPWLANSLTTLLSGVTLMAIGGGGYWIWSQMRGNDASQKRQHSQGTSRRRRPKAAAIVKATPQRVEKELHQVGELLDGLQNEITRRSLRQQARLISQELSTNQLRLVVFGTSSAGKTSLVNALLGYQVGATAPTLGTTQSGSFHTYSLPGIGGKIEIADTPGLQAVGLTGESKAIAFAKNADLLLFVVAGDMTATEYDQLAALGGIGKRMVLVFNKADQFLPEDITDITESLKHKAQPLLPTHNVVTVAADPSPIKVRRHQLDGSIVEAEAERLPDTDRLTQQISKILKKEGKQLRLANALQKTRSLADGARTAIAASRRSRAEQLIQQMQWTTAAAIALNPLPAIDLLAAAAINGNTIAKLHTIYDRKITLKRAEQMAKSLGKVLAQVGGIELATQVVGSALKASPLAAMGVSLQAISCAYLTRVAGFSYLDWLESDDGWSEDTMITRLKEQLHLGNRSEFLQVFMAQALSAAKQSLFPTSGTSTATANDSETGVDPPKDVSSLPTVATISDLDAITETTDRVTAKAS